MSHDVFISYATEDLKIVESISDFLETNRIKCWYAKRDLKPGHSWISEIVSNIEQSKVILLIHTINSNESVEVYNEIYYVTYYLPHYKLKTIPIIPYKIGDFTPSDRLAIRLCDAQSINVKTALNNDNLIKILEAITGIISVNIPSTGINIEKRTLYRLFIRNKIDESVSIWIINGTSDINKQKHESESIVSLMGAIILDFSLITKNGNVEMSDDFKDLIVKSGGVDLFKNVRDIEKEVIDYVLTNLVEKTSEINYSKNIGKLQLKPQLVQNNEKSPITLKVSSNPNIILTAGDTSVITAQLYIGGVPLINPGITINFSIDNDSLAFLPPTKTAITNTNGQSQIILTSKEYPGTITVIAETTFNGIILKDKILVISTTWGSIYGKIYDKNRNGVPAATVKLWKCRYNEDKKVYERLKLYPSPENPQQTVSRYESLAYPSPEKPKYMISRFPPIGGYTFYRIPTGTYQITAEKNDASGNNHMGFAIVDLKPGSNCYCIVIPDLIVSLPVTTPPVPSVKFKFFRKLFHL